jgi:citrate synthase
MAELRKTAIADVAAARISIRGYEITDIIGRVSFASAVYLILKGELPNEKQAVLFEAILVSVLDHGVSPPSTIAAVTVANTGAALNAAVAAGILAINKFHGGAIEDSMTAITEAATISDDPDEAASVFVSKSKALGRRIAGFGHRQHAADPRTDRLFELARELGLNGKCVLQAEAIEKALSESSGRLLPINADGAIAALLCDLEFPPTAANGIFMIARVPGLVAHVIEEQERNPPMRTVKMDEYEYDGPVNRQLDTA